MRDLCVIAEEMERGFWPRTPNEDGIERELLTNTPIYLKPDYPRRRFGAFPGKHVREILKDMSTELRSFALV